jgi:nucleoside-diphosphate-sugar epimerase
MRTLVTGAAGKLGRAVVEELVAHGHTVHALDRVPVPAQAGVTSTVVDLADHGQVLEAVAGGTDDRGGAFDAVVHLGAIPAPGNAPNGVVFRNNTVATYNVFAAARAAGVRKVVWASSETLLGLPFDELPSYLPVDEEQPVRPGSTYSLGKALDEEMARHFARWDPQSSLIGLRFSNVMTDEDYARFDSWQDDPSLRAWNLWGYIDARDGAQAVRLALQADLHGAEVFIVAAADTVLRAENSTVLTGRYAEVPVTGDVSGRNTLLSIRKAREQLGYDPRYSWVDRV